MAAAYSSPPWRLVTRPSDDDRGDGASGVKLGPTDATPERPSSHNTASPEDSCAICLGAPENKSFTDSCFHIFCFACLAEWAKVKAECPLCKQRFKSIIHSVRSLEVYDQYFVSEVQRAQTSSSRSYPMEYFNVRVRSSTTMTNERWQQLAMTRQPQERLRHTTMAALSRRYQERYIPRGAITSAERQELYGLDLWAVPSYSHYREASPRFYRENPACTHRLVPWLNRELNALMPSQSRVRCAMDKIMALILDFDIRHPAFAAALHPFLDQHVEHFVYEFYLFATSVHDMVAYDRNTVYKSRGQAYCRGDPVGRFQMALLEQNQTAVQPATARRESPQPGPSGLGAVRREVITSADSDSDSDSSDCILVKVVKPQRERTPVVIELLSSSDDERDLLAPGPSRDRHSERAGGASQSSGLSPNHCSSPDFDALTSLSRDSPELRDVSSVSRGSLELRDVSSVSRGSPELRDVSSASRGSSEFQEISNLSSEHERPQSRHSRGHSKSSRDRRQRMSSSASSSQSTRRRMSSCGSSLGECSRHVPVVRKQERAADDWETSSDEDSLRAAQTRLPRKLVSVVVAVNNGSRMTRETSGREHRCSHHHRRHHEHKARTKTPKRKHRRRSSSQEF